MRTIGFDGTEIVRVLAGQHITVTAMADVSFIASLPEPNVQWTALIMSMNVVGGIENPWTA